MFLTTENFMKTKNEHAKEIFKNTMKKVKVVPFIKNYNNEKELNSTEFGTSLSLDQISSKYPFDPGPSCYENVIMWCIGLQGKAATLKKC